MCFQVWKKIVNYVNIGLGISIYRRGREGGRGGVEVGVGGGGLQANVLFSSCTGISYQS